MNASSCRFRPFRTLSRPVCRVLGPMMLLVAAQSHAAVVTVPTMDTSALAAALHPVGLTITSVSIRNGQPGQFGTFSNFEIPPVTIRPGIVLSSGDVTSLGPLAAASDPAYDPASPPPEVNSQMTPEPDSGGTPEFDEYGSTGARIENFSASYDVAALRVDFTLATDIQVKFDFIFATVEYPVYTSSYTDAFLVFLDGTQVTDQITYDASGNPVQVGRSFAGLETIADQNTAFSSPHGLIHHLTTTTAVLSAGHHHLIFEVGDVNDHILDSAVFIANLRAEAGTEGTDPSDDNHGPGCPVVTDSPMAVTACPSSRVSFSASADGDHPLRYEWRKDGVAIDPDVNPSADSDNLEINSASAADSGVYDCRISNSCGSAFTSGAVLTVCVGDFNCDGGVDGTDVNDFFTAWESGDTIADVNADGGVDGADVNDFFTHWEAGC